MQMCGQHGCRQHHSAAILLISIAYRELGVKKLPLGRLGLRTAREYAIRRGRQRRHSESVWPISISYRALAIENWSLGWHWGRTACKYVGNVHFDGATLPLFGLFLHLTVHWPSEISLLAGACAELRVNLRSKVSLLQLWLLSGRLGTSRVAFSGSF